MAIKEIKIPDLGGAAGVDVIELNVQVGDSIEANDPIVTLEGDKASMEIPSPFAGVIKTIAVDEGDKVSEGDLLGTMEVSGETTEDIPIKEEVKSEEPAQEKPATKVEMVDESPKAAPTPAKVVMPDDSSVHAGPGVRRMAFELGVNLSSVPGSGPKGRVVKEDVLSFVKKQMTTGGGGSALPGIPPVDFTKFGDIEKMPLNKIKRLTAEHMHRCWVNIPHVTQFEEADITDLEAFRQAQKKVAGQKNIRLTPLAFIMKAAVAALKEFPTFNSSLSPEGDALLLKQYYHIGVAVDTPDGLVVPVVRDVDQKGIFELAAELGEISEKARNKQLKPGDLQGGSFTISSLGGIGGTGFTPIVNAPEVAILGVSKSSMKPVYENGEFIPKLILPFSLSYDHRVIDGAEAARFCRFLSSCLADLRTLIL